MDFGGAAALVTGGSSGIGLATARQLAAHGAHVWLVARNEERLKTALAQVECNRISPEQRFGYAAADVGEAEQAATAVTQVQEQVGVPDLVLNCAGVAHPGYFQELDLEIFRWMMQVNYFGTVHVTKAVVPGMIARRSGHIVNISSVAGFLGVFGYTAYGASKYAVRGFSEVLRAEMKPYGVKVSVVFPPDCDTPQLAYEDQYKPPETRALASNSTCLSPDQVAAAILKGVSKGRYVILPGLEASLLYRLSGLVGGLTYPIMDYLIARARRGQGRA
ncbi:MAG: SDR family oxidoreductase [Anaerolineae bacterium]|nr:SDR family oxidoreductase [Anaerolineae bacterium]